MSFFDNVKAIVTGPVGFFGSVKSDGQILKPWLHYVCCMGIYYLVLMLVSIPISIQNHGEIAGIFGGLSLPLYIAINMVVQGFVFLFSIGVIFLGAGIMHILLMIVGTNKGYVETFKLAAYASTVFIFLAPFALLQAVPIIGPVLFLGLLLLASVYMMYVEVQGARVLHELSTARAVVGLVVIPVILTLILIAIAVLFFIGVLAAVMSADPGITGMLSVI